MSRLLSVAGVSAFFVAAAAAADPVAGLLGLTWACIAHDVAKDKLSLVGASGRGGTSAILRVIQLIGILSPCPSLRLACRLRCSVKTYTSALVHYRRVGFKKQASSTMPITEPIVRPA